jgi:hypothetical protein
MYSITGNNVEYEGAIGGRLAEKYLGFDIDALQLT